MNYVRVQPVVGTEAPANGHARAFAVQPSASNLAGAEHMRYPDRDLADDPAVERQTVYGM